jgi:hypothetical protein
MTKATVSRLFIGGTLAVIAGAVLAIAAVWIAIANDVFVMNGPDIVAVRGSALAWALLALGIVGGLAIVAGSIAGLVSWIGALLNTSQLESKAWFLALLLLGIFSFGFIAMIAYAVAGPDGTVGGGRPAQVAAEATAA